MLFSNIFMRSHEQSPIHVMKRSDFGKLIGIFDHELRSNRGFKIRSVVDVVVLAVAVVVVVLVQYLLI